MSCIKDMNIFVLKRFVGNIKCKLSTVTDYYAKQQILCVVSESNELLLHFTNIKKCDNLRVVTWFQKSSKNIIDICFDPTGIWLLVLCIDNTIHIVPTFKVLSKHSHATNSAFSTNFITSYQIPFFGSPQYDTTSQMQCDIPEYTIDDFHDESYSHTRLNLLETTNELSITPSCVTWWNTSYNRNRAIIGYSNGNICVFGMDSNTPFRATTSVGSTSVDKLLIYKDNAEKNIILLVTLQNKEQYRVILEQWYNELKFPSALPQNMTVSKSDCKTRKSMDSLQEENNIDKSTASTNSPQILKSFTQVESDGESSTISNLRLSTKSRLASLMLGSKKSNILKISRNEDNAYKDTQVKDVENIDFIFKPELINNKHDCIYVTQHIRNISFLSVLDSESNTLSVHHMDSNLVPLFRYKVPEESKEILITSNILYSIQNSYETDHLKSSITLLSSALASIKDNSDKYDYQHAVLSSFNFYNENVINIHRKANFFCKGKEKLETCDTKESILTNSDKYYFYGHAQSNTEYSTNDEIQKIIFDPCYVITDTNIYYIDMRKDPLKLIIDAALSGLWTQCEQFCNTFNIPFSRCLEFVGDQFLRNKKVNQALLSFNVVKIPPVRTALKLAINRENYPLMHLCAMALKHVNVTKSKYFFNCTILKTILQKIQNLHVEDVIKILPKRRKLSEPINEGQLCSDHIYVQDDSVTSLQMTLSSQFHLSNLMLITLAEKVVRDRNYIPLWNFIISNGKYHTHMTSIVLAQSGLHSSAVVLAMTRGCFIEVFIALTSVVNQEFGVYTEINICLYNLSDPIFLECLLYLQNVSEQYLNTVQKKLSIIKFAVLNRLEKQFSPFAPIFRSMFEKYYLEISEQIGSTEKNYNFISFFSTLIETYLAIIIHMHGITSEESNILNAFSTFNIEYQDPKLQFTSNKFPPVSVGYTHSTCVVDGVAYFWGSSSVPTVFSIENLQDTNQRSYTVKSLDLLRGLNLEVFAVKCGRQHTIILTNNGVFTFGSNQLYQLGIGKNILAAQHPMLVQYLDYKNITLLDAGQYHNAVVADNKLYTWGWGLYGQLGQGDTENVPVPTVVAFFNDKQIINISLGHAHSLVLCSNSTYTELYVFGSNHFGQLGIGISGQETQISNKILSPYMLNIGKNLILIQTNFFSNLAVTDSNELYTWGLSPQALRLENQNKKRANSKQKIAATLTKEIRRRTGAVAECNSFDMNINETKSSNLTEEPKNNGECDSLSWTNTIDENYTRDKQKLSAENYQRSQFTTTQNNKELFSEQQPVGPPNVDHMTPRLVDTDKISGNISYIATGLFHYAVICSNNLLYTWGRNFDHQLGNQDKERKYVYAPAKVDCIDDALYVDCGADFTIVVTKENIVKAFGGNANGQCGLDIKQSVQNTLNQNRLLCLPSTKRFMRFESQSIVYPHTIDIPGTKSDFPYKKHKYFKALPEYNSNNVTKIHPPLCKESNNLFLCKNKSNSTILNAQQLKPLENEASDTELTFNYPSQTGNCNSSSDFIHYCLYIFHNLYNPEKVMNFVKENSEFHIRILLLNLDFEEAFKICLMNCHTGANATRIFQYFTKNDKVVPIKTEKFKIYIHGLLNNFVERNYDMADCELFFSLDLDYYLVELFFVLYLNSGPSKLTTVLRQKLEDALKIQNTQILFDATDIIFEKLSIKFKTTICRKILKRVKGY